MLRLFNGVLQDGGPEVRKDIIPTEEIQKANDNDAVDHAWIYPDSFRRRIAVAIEKKQKPEEVLEEVIKAAEKNPGEENKAILIHTINELGSLPENESLINGLLESERFINLIQKGGI
jgi:exoribonuclease R